MRLRFFLALVVVMAPADAVGSDAAVCPIDGVVARVVGIEGSPDGMRLVRNGKQLAVRVGMCILARII
jgi:hypothetical protein